MRTLVLMMFLAACGSRAMEGGGDGGGTGGPDACKCPGDGGGGGGDGSGTGTGTGTGSGSGCTGGAVAAAQPFGNHARPLPSGAIVPDQLSQGQLDDAVRAFYDYWAGKYMKQGCGDGRYYVAFDGGGLTVSEAHGFGMVILAFMAGHDPNAQAMFDGMYQYYVDHPSDTTPALMAWKQDTSCNDTEGADSATDGDLDIAYALLLADKQWSSGGAIDYHAAALKIIDGIRAGDVDGNASYLRLGDWATDGSFGDSTRTSDFMPDHMISYAAASGNSDWTHLADSEYAIMDALQTQYAPQSGLLPDFVATPASGPKPVTGTFLEGPDDGHYYYNACRDPMRIAIGFLADNDARARTIAGRMSTWIRGATGGDPQAIRPGYKLDGSPLSGNYFDTSFVAPFGVAAMVDASNQQWLDSIWDAVATPGSSDSGYYGDTITMLSLIAMSGNWWTPEAAPCPS